MAERTPSPEDSLRALAALLAAERSVISPHAGAPADVEPALGLLVAAGNRAAGNPGAYALVIESIREGYLLHYGEPRVVVGADHDLALLAGDYLYARGLERLAALGDLEAVRELSDLISLAAQLNEPEQGDGGGADALWLGSVVAVAAGKTDPHEQAKSALREGRAGATGEMWESTRAAAAAVGLGDGLERAAKAIGFVR
jgi:hypothetical protein